MNTFLKFDHLHSVFSHTMQTHVTEFSHNITSHDAFFHLYKPSETKAN